MKLLGDVIDNRRVGETIFAMHWSRVSLEGAAVTFLTSDRPLDMPMGLSDPNAYIALPIGPKLLFVAAHNDQLARKLRSTDPTRVVCNVNQSIVGRARTFAWGVDTAQLRFVTNRISSVPDRPVLTEEQKLGAIEAMRSGL